MNDPLFLLVMLCAFVAAFAAVEAIYLWWSGARSPEVSRVARRLQMLADAGTTESSVLRSHLGNRRPVVEQLLVMLPRTADLERLLIQSGAPWTLSGVLMTSVNGFVLVLLGALLIGIALLPALLLALLAGASPVFTLLVLRARRLKRFELLLPDALDLIGRALRAGHALPSALQMAGSELPAPIGTEFKRVFDEINFGVSAQDALQNLAARVPSTDLGFFVIAVLIQRETGGNLAEVLSNISLIIRDRLKLMGKVRTLSAEGRLSGLVLTVLPFLTGLLLYAIDPSFMSTLWTHPTGLFLLKFGLFFMVVGVIWMRAIVSIRV